MDGYYVLASHRKVVRASGWERPYKCDPHSMFVWFGSYHCVMKNDRYFFIRSRPAPDWYLCVALEYYVISKQIRKPNIC